MKSTDDGEASFGARRENIDGDLSPIESGKSRLQLSLPTCELLDFDAAGRATTHSIARFGVPITAAFTVVGLAGRTRAAWHASGCKAFPVFATAQSGTRRAAQRNGLR